MALVAYRLVTAKSPPEGSGLPDRCFVETGRLPAFSKGDPTLLLATNVTTLGQHADEALGAIVRKTTEEVAAKPEYVTYGRGEV
ncbi:hypothetical protein AJ88_15780 [Mesorhizobium amorphae CCBAU 01583]|nr:hypothetical protein AJ88_15780 [Mesorhizobium amorphae CCBAU 01583]